MQKFLPVKGWKKFWKLDAWRKKSKREKFKINGKLTIRCDILLKYNSKKRRLHFFWKKNSFWCAVINYYLLFITDLICFRKMMSRFEWLKGISCTSFCSKKCCTQNCRLDFISELRFDFCASADFQFIIY